MSSFLELARPYRRVTLTPQARLSALAQLLDLICGFRCAVHNHRAGVHQIMNGRISYSACCEDVLDAIEHALEDLHIENAKAGRQ